MNSMETLEQLKVRIQAAAPGAQVEIVPNGCAASPPSLLLDRGHARAVAEFLREDAALRLDYASNVTGVDWPEKTVKEKVKVTHQEIGCGGVEQTVERRSRKRRTRRAGLFRGGLSSLLDVLKKHGPVMLRMRTENRSGQGCRALADPGLAESRVSGARGFRPVRHGVQGASGPAAYFDVAGVHRSSHAASDYVAPDDYEYEPTPHDAVLAKAEAHRDRDQGSGVREQGTIVE
jgi:NADH-quinone oxidoreductase subunit C